ncbi:hypothetical protein AYI70_g8846 [Smittium culicis]|uniref:Uncharacterized protein n=1 Tax=Smittium culicis TaxID=133412 RepID=A0A1R1XE21_9FUNG|nr:hypothetical protein AYI70_g8846 [Smittium culicis]
MSGWRGGGVSQSFVESLDIDEVGCRGKYKFAIVVCRDIDVIIYSFHALSDASKAVDLGEKNIDISRGQTGLFDVAHLHRS